MIYDIAPMNSYNGNNSTTTFDFDFYIENASELKVYYYSKTNEKKLLVYGLDYTIQEFKNNNGSSIIFPIEGSSYSVLSEEEKITLELTLPISQETNYTTSSLLNLNTLEYSLDYLTRLIQILANQVKYCVKSTNNGEYYEEIIDNIDQKYASISKSINTIDELNKSNQAQLEQLTTLANSIDSGTIIKDLEELTTQISQKADLDLSNSTSPIVNAAYLKTTFSNDYNWYRIYSDGWCEQGGYEDYSSYVMGMTKTISLQKEFNSTNYNIQLCQIQSSYGANLYINSSITTTNFGVNMTSTSDNARCSGFYWVAKGYLKNGEY